MKYKLVTDSTYGFSGSIELQYLNIFDILLKSIISEKKIIRLIIRYLTLKKWILKNNAYLRSKSEHVTEIL